MKSTRTDRAQDIKPEYPCMKQHSEGIVVLFSEDGVGTVVQQKFSHASKQVGDHRTDWLEKGFTPFYGTIELSQ